MMTTPKKVIIIGGGVAGLSAGIYGRINGLETEIIEMHDIPGGQCTAWERKGYRFDYCLHWLVGTAKGPFHDIWFETGALDSSIPIIDHEIHTRIINEKGEEFILYTDIDRWEKYLVEMAPEDKKPIRKMCNEMRKSFNLETFSKPPGFRNLFDYLKLTKMLPLLGMMNKYGGMEARDYFKNLRFRNEKLNFFLNSIFGDMEFSALAFLMMLAWFGQKNAGYPIGGSLPFSTRMTEKFKNLGGKLTLGDKVQKIIVKEHKAIGVVLEDGEEIRADYVISAADGYSTIFNMLEGKYVSPEIKIAYETWTLFTPIVQVSFGINKVYQEDCVNNNYLAKGSKIGSTALKNGYSIMNYAFDRTMAPGGKSVIVLRFESPWEIWEGMGSEAYKLEKKRIEEDATGILEKIYPGVTQWIEVTDVATPKTEVEYTGVWKGSYEGFLPSSKNLMKNLDMTLPGLNNFYMVGQWLFPGGGLPPSAQSGKWVIQMICREEGKKFKVS
jgi:phytoene dehydrogenase-like protein